MDHVAAAGGLARCSQLCRRALDPRAGAEILEQVERGAQLLAGVDPTAGPAQPLAVGQFGTGTIGPPQRPLVSVEGSRKCSSAAAPSARSARPCAAAATAEATPVASANPATSAPAPANPPSRSRSNPRPRPAASTCPTRRHPGPPAPPMSGTRVVHQPRHPCSCTRPAVLSQELALSSFAAPTANRTVTPDVHDTSTLTIGGMTCASCVSRVERALSRVRGVASAEVNPATEVATVRFDSHSVELAELGAAVARAGYTATPRNAAPNAERVDRDLLDSGQATPCPLLSRA